MSAAPLNAPTSIQPVDLETRVANRKRELIAEIVELKRNSSRLGSAAAIEGIKARLSALALIMKERVVDGWANVSPSTSLELDEWVSS